MRNKIRNEVFGQNMKVPECQVKDFAFRCDMKWSGYEGYRIG